MPSDVRWFTLALGTPRLLWGKTSTAQIDPLMARVGHITLPALGQKKKPSWRLMLENLPASRPVSFPTCPGGGVAEVLALSPRPNTSKSVLSSTRTGSHEQKSRSSVEGLRKVAFPAAEAVRETLSSFA